MLQKTAMGGATMAVPGSESIVRTGLHRIIDSCSCLAEIPGLDAILSDIQGMGLNMGVAAIIAATCLLH